MHMKLRTKIVIDTGVLISAFAFGGVPARAVSKAFRDSTIYVSQPLLIEYRSVPVAIYQSGKISHDQYQALIAGIAAFVAKSIPVVAPQLIHLCRDPKDDMVLDCCRAAQADLLISGDKDLLSMSQLPFPLRIVTAKEFLVG